MSAFFVFCVVLGLLGSEASAQSSRLSMEVLQNSKYRVEEETIKLKNGRFLRKSRDNFLDVRLSRVAFGDLDKDGSEDAVVLLVYNSGGSGSFYQLSAVLNKNGIPQDVASTVLGDRVVVQSFGIRSGRIVTEMITHGPEDPSCCPTLKETLHFTLAGSELVED